MEGDFDGAWAGCGCAHAPSNRAAKSTFEALGVISSVSPAMELGYYRQAPLF
jgi:hypothetical protein